MTDPDNKADMCSEGLDTIREAARFLGLSVSKVYQLMEKGELPYVEIGKCRRIPHRAVVELAASNLVQRHCS